MRLMRDLPEIEVKISEGLLSLTNLNLAQNLFNKEKQASRKLDLQIKASFVKKLENKSTRQAIKIATSVCPEFKPVSKFDFNVVEDDALREKLLKVKGRYAHVDPHMDLTALLHKLCDDVLEKPMREPKREPGRKISAHDACLLPAHDACLLPAREVKPNHRVVSTTQTAAKSKAQIRREVWRRDQAQCSNCGSTYALEKDHTHPRARAVDSTPSKT